MLAYGEEIKDHFWRRFFGVNLFFPIVVQIAIGLIGWVGPDFRTMWVAFGVIALINIANVALGFRYAGWKRVAFWGIIFFNLISLFAMGGLAFFTSVFGWLHIVPDVVALLASL